jgi:hypothetical protein
LIKISNLPPTIRNQPAHKWLELGYNLAGLFRKIFLVKTAKEKVAL